MFELINRVIKETTAKRSEIGCSVKWSIGDNHTIELVIGDKCVDIFKGDEQGCSEWLAKKVSFMAIEHAYTKVAEQIETRNSKLDNPMSFHELTQTIIDLCEIIMDNETDESTWSIGGESRHFSLGDFLIGAWEFYSGYHGGQTTIEYAALSQIGRIVENCSVDSLESPEADAYAALVSAYRGWESYSTQIFEYESKEDMEFVEDHDDWLVCCDSAMIIIECREE